RQEDRYADGDEFREALSSWLAAEYPQTAASRIESFLHDLFAEDIERARREREELPDKIRNRVQTMPPSDELRRALEQSGEIAVGVRRTEDSVGRRARDRGEPEQDRRQVPDRRQSGQHGPGAPGPGPGPGARRM